jgi:hypothetical protein
MSISSPNDKYVLARPRGGLNDLLCSIAVCWDYCHRTGRRLIVDTRRSGLSCNFWNYFSVSGSDVNCVLADFDPISFNSVSCFPDTIFGCIDTYWSEYEHAIGKYVDQKSRVPLTFEFDKEYSEDLLIHEQGWLPTSIQDFLLPASIKLLQKVWFNAGTAEKIQQRLLLLPQAYDAVHIRNSDYKTDYPAFFNQIENEISSEYLLMCSDDLAVFQFAEDFFKNRAVIRLSRFSQSSGTVLHSITRTEADQAEYNIDTFVDLLALARAHKLFVTNVTKVGRPSGFSLLALALHHNPHIRDLVLFGNLGGGRTT